MLLVKLRRIAARILLSLVLLLSACQAGGPPQEILVDEVPVQPTPTELVLTPYPTRPVYQPGELVDYVAQPGDSLQTIASHFNTSVEEILRENSFIPRDATTMPPGMPMKIPIYYAPFWGSPLRILPNGLFINGPAQVGFSTADFINQYPGWLKDHYEWASGANRSAAELIDLAALDHSVSPRLLLALLEYQSQGLSAPEVSSESMLYPLGLVDPMQRGLYWQLMWAANLLNNGYYGWQTGELMTFDLLNERIERPDPWQSAATVALQYYFSRLLDEKNYLRAIGEDGLSKTYTDLFGDPWLADQPHIPGSLVQPEFLLPMQPGKTWAYTGGPHSAWGDGAPLAAVDFAPAAQESGCVPTDEWATAVASGVVARSQGGLVMLDLDGDGDERTGWVVLYLHIDSVGQMPLGKQVKAGDLMGHPSCEGGRATGTHLHIARKYNGEWISAGSVLPFNLSGWRVQYGSRAYLGYLIREGKVITACTCSDYRSQIRLEEEIP